MKTWIILIGSILLLAPWASAQSQTYIDDNFMTGTNWRLIENDGTGSFVTTVGIGTLMMDGAFGGYAIRLQNIMPSGQGNLVPFYGAGTIRLEAMALMSGNQGVFVQAEEFDASGNYLGQKNVLDRQMTAGIYTVNLEDVSWNAAATQLRFILGGSNFSGLQGTVELDRFVYTASASSLPDEF